MPVIYRLLHGKVNRAAHKYSARTSPIRHVVVHTAEMPPDKTAPYTGAYRLSEYGANTSRSASWHAQVDSGGVLFQLPDSKVANHAAGNNGTSLGVELVMRASDWEDEPSEWRNLLYLNAVELVAEWCYKYDIPVRRPEVTKTRRIKSVFKGRDHWREIADNRFLEPGIYAHGDLDPTRRHDPGKRFPWTFFLEEVAGVVTRLRQKELEKTGDIRPKQNNETEDPMAQLTEERVEFLDDFAGELLEVDARGSSLAYALRFYRKLAELTGFSGNNPEKVAEVLATFLRETK